MADISIKRRTVTIIDFNGKKFMSDDIVTVSKNDGSIISGRIVYSGSVFSKYNPEETLALDVSTKFNEHREYINVNDIKDINEYIGEQDEKM